MELREAKTREEFIATLPLLQQLTGNEKDALSEEQMTENFVQSIPYGYRHFYTTDNNGKMIAVAGMAKTFNPTFDAPAYDLTNFVVDHSCRQQGVGSQFIQLCIDFARAEGCKYLRLCTYGDNIPAVNFYAKHKFRHTSNFMVHYLTGDKAA